MSIEVRMGTRESIRSGIMMPDLPEGEEFQPIIESIRSFIKSINYSRPFYVVAAAIASSGINVILDHVLTWGEVELKECLQQFDDLEAVFIGVKCPVEELERREALRGDRAKGLARWQSERVHAHGIYDIEVDSSVLTPHECASTIIEYLNTGRSPKAFELLREKIFKDCM